MKKVIYLFVLCMVLGLAGCGQSQENKESSTESTSVQVENKNVSDIVSNEHLTNNDTANFQMPEEGYYSNDFINSLRLGSTFSPPFSLESWWCFPLFAGQYCLLKKTPKIFGFFSKNFLSSKIRLSEKPGQAYRYCK